jgi:hypothetical protein
MGVFCTTTCTANTDRGGVSSREPKQSSARVSATLLRWRRANLGGLGPVASAFASSDPSKPFAVADKSSTWTQPREVPWAVRCLVLCRGRRPIVLSRRCGQYRWVVFDASV